MDPHRCVSRAENSACKTDVAPPPFSHIEAITQTNLDRPKPSVTMPVAEVAGVISAIITIIEASIKIYHTASDASGPPQSFRDAASRLPLIQDTLKLAVDGLAEEALDPESRASLATVLEKCTDRAAMLLDIFQAVVASAGTSKTEIYLKALKTIPKAERVETLMNGIMEDLQLLATNHAVKAATRKQIEALMDRMDVYDDTCPSPITLNNSGSGGQYIHNGIGHQHIMSGTGTQINGSFNGGTFSFYQK